MITLYDYELSGNCYKLRLFMGMLGVEYTSKPVDFYPGCEHESDAFRQINPLEQLPVLDDNGLILRDSQACLVYLAAKYDSSGLWYPCEEPALLGQVTQWLAFADAITATSSAARLHDALFYEHFDIESCRRDAHKLFRILDEHLYFMEMQQSNWICAGESPTIADIACFPYVILSEEGGISRMDYPAIRRWCDRVKRIERFSVMPGIFPAGR